MTPTHAHAPVAGPLPPRESAAPDASASGPHARLLAGAGACALVVAAFFLPIWHARLIAPQYPGGLQVSVADNGIHGDVAEINELNHYIGMRPMSQKFAPERVLWKPTLVLALGAVAVATFAARKRTVMLARLALWSVVPGVLADIQFRLWQFGHDLDPKAALRIDEFTPLVIGPTSVWNFKTWAYPGLALAALLGAAVVASFGPRLAARLRLRIRTRAGAGLAAGLAAGLVLLTLPAATPALAQEHEHEHEHSLSPSGAVATPEHGPRAARSLDGIAAAIAKAPFGGVVHVAPGTYRGRLVIDKPVTIVGHGRPLIEGPREADVVVVRARDVTIRGIDVAGGGDGPVGNPAGVRVEGNGTHIEDVSIADSYHGIFALGVQGLRIERVKIAGRGGVIDGEAHATRADAHATRGDGRQRGDGISLHQTRGTLVREALIHEVRDGMYLSYAEELLIDSSSVHHSRYGIHSMFARDIVVFENRFERNRSGAVLMYGGNTFLLRNRFASNVSPSTGFGVIAKDVADLRATENDMLMNRVGVQLDGPAGLDVSRTTFVGNTIARNTIGVALMPTAAVTFTRNRFAENLVQVAPMGGRNPSRWASKGAGNYWSSYRGFDRRDDGIGDVAHAEPPLVADVVSRAPMLVALASSPGFQLLSGLRARWAQLEPILVDELPLSRPWATSHAGTAAVARPMVGALVPVAAATLSLIVVVALIALRGPRSSPVRAGHKRTSHVLA